MGHYMEYPGDGCRACCVVLDVQQEEDGDPDLSAVDHGPPSEPLAIAHQRGSRVRPREEAPGTSFMYTDE